MIIESVKLINFRNHHEYHLDCQENTSLILGENGCGKTSVLEAIYILTRGKSFRAVDSEIINRDSDFYRIELKYLNGEIITATYDRTNKNFIHLDQKNKRLPNKYKYPVVLFLPSDLNLISHAPGRRRDYFDRIFSQLDDNYATSLTKYKKALKQRNEILKQEQISSDTLFSWNLLLAKYGSSICKKRDNFIQEINSLITPTYRSIAQNSDQINIKYQSEALNKNEQNYLYTLEKNFSKDQILGHTSFGIHRDDYIFKFNHQPADGSASRGETRSIILALKFIEAKLIESKLNKKPLILLDDVFSELDNSRRQCLVENFKDHQVIITSVEDIK